MKHLRKRKPKVMIALMKVNKAKRLELKRKRREIKRMQNLISALEHKIMASYVSWTTGSRESREVGNRLPLLQFLLSSSTNPSASTLKAKSWSMTLRTTDTESPMLNSELKKPSLTQILMIYVKLPNVTVNVANTLKESSSQARKLSTFATKSKPQTENSLKQTDSKPVSHSLLEQVSTLAQLIGLQILEMRLSCKKMISWSLTLELT
jgi:hypothetical protein